MQPVRPPGEMMSSSKPIKVLSIQSGENMDDLVGKARSRMAQEIADAGVVIEHLHPTDVENARKESPEAFQAMADRIRDADLVLFGPNTNCSPLARATVLLRQDIPQGTWLDDYYERGLQGIGYFPGSVSDECFRFGSVDQMMLALHEQHVRPASNHTQEVLDYRTGVRPPRPLPFRSPEWGCTEKETYGTRGATLLTKARGGLLDPAVAVFEGYGELGASDLIDYVEWMFEHLPSDRLPSLADERMRPVWAALENRADLHQPWMKETHMIRSALIRDGGVHTLAMCPPRMLEIRARIEEEWGADVAKSLGALPDLRFSYEARDAWGLKPIRLLADSALIPQEDPFEGGAVGPNYLPTYHTLCVARRYRPATEVVRLAAQLFGSRPFVRDDAGHQLMWFVEDSPPSSIEEVAEWCRLLHALQGKTTIRKRVAFGCAKWPAIPPDVFPFVVAEWRENQPMGTQHPYTKIPWLGADGRPKPEMTEGMLGAPRVFGLREAELRERGGPHPLPMEPRALSR